MIEKISGQVAYAVLQFGGFLGIGSDYYPIPWDSLTYDTSLGGTASISPRSSSKGRRSTRVRIGTGTIARVVARSTIITARRGETIDHAGAGRWPPGRRPCLSEVGVPGVRAHAPPCLWQAVSRLSAHPGLERVSCRGSLSRPGVGRIAHGARRLCRGSCPSLREAHVDDRLFDFRQAPTVTIVEQKISP
jgi:hypothetical protein